MRGIKEVPKRSPMIDNEEEAVIDQASNTGEYYSGVSQFARKYTGLYMAMVWSLIQ